MIVAIAFRLLVFLLPHAWLYALLTALFPLRVINGEAGPYLSRWVVRAKRDGGWLYLHFFHRGDVDRALHNHPWAGRGRILAYGYTEERRYEEGYVLGEDDKPPTYKIRVLVYRFGEATSLWYNTFHRVTLLRPKKGCWTYLSTTPREQSWSFWSPETGAETPWRDYLRGRVGMPRDGGTMKPREW